MPGRRRRDRRAARAGLPRRCPLRAAVRAGQARARAVGERPHPARAARAGHRPRAGRRGAGRAATPESELDARSQLLRRRFPAPPRIGASATARWACCSARATTATSRSMRSPRTHGSRRDQLSLASGLVERGLGGSMIRKRGAAPWPRGLPWSSCSSPQSAAYAPPERHQLPAVTTSQTTEDRLRIVENLSGDEARLPHRRRMPEGKESRSIRDFGFPPMPIVTRAEFGGTF